jgi:hypothetical protein
MKEVLEAIDQHSIAFILLASFVIILARVMISPLISYCDCDEEDNEEEQKSE